MIDTFSWVPLTRKSKTPSIYIETHCMETYTIKPQTTVIKLSYSEIYCINK